MENHKRSTLNHTTATLILATSIFFVGCSSGGSSSPTSPLGQQQDVAPLLGELDTSYNGTGVQMSVGASMSMTTQMRGLVFLPEGAAMAGFAETTTSPNQAYLRAVSVDGSTHLASHDAGFPECAALFGTAYCQFGDLSQQADGKMLLSIGVQSPSPAVHIVRLKSDGQMDTSFATLGVLSLPGISAALLPRLQMQNDGKIVALMEAWIGTPAVLTRVVFRLNADGTPDMSFGVNAKVDLSLLPNIISFTVNAQTGDIYVFGRELTTHYVMHVTPQGEEDLSYGNSGRIQIGTDSSEGGAISFDPATQKVVITTLARGSGSEAEKEMRVVRLNSDGQLDTGFATAGILQHSMITRGEEIYKAYDLIPDTTSGKMLVLGRVSWQVEGEGETTFVVSRLTADGQFDASFAVSGHLYGPRDKAYLLERMKITADGLLQLGGMSADLLSQCVVATSPCPAENGYIIPTNFRAAFVRVK
ncbi:MAG: hypothetical protein KF799_14790 [Bdellovibrionales bacterium]|nr:hypothetical protein [Bdellovibrionales bacterium]